VNAAGAPAGPALSPPATRAPAVALLVAGAVSLLGNQLTALAIPWFVLQTTGSAVKTGVVGFAVMLPTVLASFAGGAVVDRLGAKRVSVLADVLSGATVALIPLLHRLDALGFGLLLVLVFLGALLDTPGATARQALLPDLAERAGLGLERANGAYHSVENAAALIGPVLAGVLAAWLGASDVLWLDAATFAVSAALVARAVPASPTAEAEATAGRYWADVVEGLRFLRDDRPVRALCAVAALVNLLATPLFVVVLPVYAERVHGSAADLGLLLAGFGGGLLAGSLLFGAVGHRLPRLATLAGGLALTGPPLAVLAATPSLPWAVAALAAAGLASGPFNPLVFTLLQERVPAELRGRVFGTVLGAALAAAPLGMLLASATIEAVGLRPVVLLVAAGFVVAAGAMIVSPALRELD